MTDLEHEPDWSVTLRRQPASLSTGHAEGDTSTFEIICRECGDDPDLDYREVSPELRQIRGPYLLKAGIAAFLKHGEYHDRAEETGTHHARPDLAIPDQAPLSHTAARYSNPCAQWLTWAGIGTRARLHCLTPSRTTPVVCIQVAKPKSARSRVTK
jgi:hypothetical protein